MSMKLRPSKSAPILCVFAAALIGACGGGGDSTPPPPGPTPGGGNPSGSLQLATLSNRADLVSDDDALVAVTMSAGGTFAGLRVDVNGRDVTSAFALTGGRMLGLVTALANGPNVISARADNMTGARLTVTNAPRSGPVITGAQPTPFYCAMPTPQIVNGNLPAVVASGLAGMPDANCTIAAEFKLYYRTTAACTLSMPDPVWNVTATATTVPAQPVASAAACFKPYNSAAPRPADMAQTTTDAGRTGDYIVRVERGVINRGIYDIVTLFNPAASWTAVAPQIQWNRKLHIAFGASTGQPRRQLRPTISWPTLDTQIRRGYIVALNSMMDSSRNSNRVLMAETVMMMKEHISDTYGTINFTIGSGCSGGSINSNMAASIMPGLLDGVITSCTYADSETTALEVSDCVFLVEAYQKPALLSVWSGLGLTQAQINARKSAINGHVDQTACHAWYNSFGNSGKAGLYFARGIPTANNDTGVIVQAMAAANNCELPNSAVYDPVNAAATAGLVHCDGPTWAESIWGRVPGTTQIRTPRDNVGVQYGLKALKDGVIDVEEFVTLNENIGGSDRDSTFRAERSVADAEALDTAYRAGVVLSGKQFAKVAVIDLRGWDDSLLAANTPIGYSSPGGIHHMWFSFAVRDRLTAESDAQDARNHALWRYSRPGLLPTQVLDAEAFNVMDAWLTALKADTSAASLEQKVRSARPIAAQDFCYLNSDVAQTTKVTDATVCDAEPFLRPSLSPRQVAGGPRAENILKCQLKPLLESDYAASTFSPTQWSRLQAVFATGVCDWSKPGVGQQASLSPLTFSAGAGGVALPEAPTSIPL